MTSPIQQGKRSEPLNVETAVRERYGQAATQREAGLCCPVDYDTRYLAAIPQEILERDYGCGDPSRYVGEGEVVLDLGSGGGKICYIAAQIVGRTGKVIGVDCNEEMLALARGYQGEMAERLGYDVVEFRKGRIQDLALDLDRLDRELEANPVRSSGDWLRVDAEAQRLRETEPMVADGSVDVVVSNCVLNLVDAGDRERLFAEVFRVLQRGGRAVISDIVADEDVPEAMRQDARLWSGCISGAFREDRFLEAFEQAGFYGIEIVARQDDPWAVVEGIELRSVTVRAFKGKEGPCLDRRQAVIYNGPWKEVVDDDGHRLLRGRRVAVCDKTFQIYTAAPYAEGITPVPPCDPVPIEDAQEFTCRGTPIRHPAETKGARRDLTILPDDCCTGESCC